MTTILAAYKGRCDLLRAVFGGGGKEGGGLPFSKMSPADMRAAFGGKVKRAGGAKT